MGYIIILTTLNIIHVYNLMGDYVAHFKGSMLKEINRRMDKKRESAVEGSKFQANSETNQQNTRKKSGN